ncbi:MAG: type II toxin-antitoxin system VapC family toxin [Thermoanaerobaculia bacterium]|nr:type II toxin-antitoxin system VapC family toxin [Thermoanaerobaculia bacterium]
MRFWDSSAVLPLILDEDQRETLLKLLEDDPVVLVWWAASVECASAISRREREGALSLAESGEALARLDLLAGSWHEVVPSDAVRTVARRLLRTHPLRAADSLQLAAAIVASEHDPSTISFVGLDARLNEAATREGFTVLPAAARLPRS